MLGTKTVREQTSYPKSPLLFQTIKRANGEKFKFFISFCQQHPSFSSENHLFRPDLCLIYQARPSAIQPG